MNEKMLPILPMTLVEALDNASTEYDDARLIVRSEARPADVRLRDLARDASIVAANFQRLGLGKGSVVAVQLPAWYEAVVAHAAISLIGGVIVPLVPGFGVSELEFITSQANVGAAITAGQWGGRDCSEAMAGTPFMYGKPHFSIEESAAPDVRKWSALLSDSGQWAQAQISPDDLAMIVYTSGTTAAPKGVKHSHRTLLAELFSVLDTERRSNLSPWPPGHIAGCLGLLRYWACGQPMVLMDRWDAADAARLIEEHKIYGTSGTPLHLGSLLDAAEADGRNLSSLTSYLAGATTIPSALIARCDELGLATFRAYGLSEHPTVSQGSPDDSLALRLGSDGRLCPGVEVRIVDDDGNNLRCGDEGEIWSRGPDLFLGYVDDALDAEAFVPGGWFRTGDIGRLDADSNLTITDRKKDIIIRGGETLSSREIEEHLAKIAGVSEVAVIGLPDQRMGERVCAVLKLGSGRQMTLEAIDAHFRTTGIARAKTPEHLVLVEDFPRTASGKIQKNILRQQLSD